VPGSANIARPGGTPLEESVETDDPSDGRAEDVEENLTVLCAFAPAGALLLVLVLAVETGGFGGVVTRAVEPACVVLVGCEAGA
jgi:hypothetical protein